MDLLKKVKQIEDKFPKLRYNDLKRKRAEDTPIICKFFDPTGSWTWYVTEAEKRGEEDFLFFGFVRGIENELGYFTLSELRSVKGRMGLGIEMDIHFGKHMLSEAMEKQI